MTRYILLSILLILSSCSLPGTQTEDTDLWENITYIETNGIAINVPKTWTGITNTANINPRAGSLVTAYVSNDAQWGFSNNLVILKDTLTDIITSEKYSTLNQIQTQKNYLEYIKKQDKILTFHDGEVSRVFVFEAKYNESTPRMQYIQTARVCGAEVYLIHFSLTVSKKADNYITLLESFTCK